MCGAITYSARGVGSAGVLRARADPGEARQEASCAGGAVRRADCRGGSASENGDATCLSVSMVDCFVLACAAVPEACGDADNLIYYCAVDFGVFARSHRAITITVTSLTPQPTVLILR